MRYDGRIQIRLCWTAPGGVIAASEWQDDTPGAREAMRKEIEEGAALEPPVLRWIDVRDVKPRWPVPTR